MEMDVRSTQLLTITEIAANLNRRPAVVARWALQLNLDFNLGPRNSKLFDTHGQAKLADRDAASRRRRSVKLQYAERQAAGAA